MKLIRYPIHYLIVQGAWSAFEFDGSSFSGMLQKLSLSLLILLAVS